MRTVSSDVSNMCLAKSLTLGRLSRIFFIAAIWSCFGAAPRFKALWQVGHSFTMLFSSSSSWFFPREITWWYSKDCLPVFLLVYVVVVLQQAHSSGVFILMISIKPKSRLKDFSSVAESKFSSFLNAFMSLLLNSRPKMLFE